MKIQNKGELLPKIWEISGGKAHTTHMETYSKYFDGHRCLSQSEESECKWTHGKDGITREFLKGATRGLREEWMEANLKGDYLKLMPGLCLEGRMNW